MDKCMDLRFGDAANRQLAWLIDSLIWRNGLHSADKALFFPGLHLPLNTYFSVNCHSCWPSLKLNTPGLDPSIAKRAGPDPVRPDVA